MPAPGSTCARCSLWPAIPTGLPGQQHHRCGVRWQARPSVARICRGRVLDDAIPVAAAMHPRWLPEQCQTSPTRDRRPTTSARWPRCRSASRPAPRTNQTGLPAVSWRAERETEAEYLRHAAAARASPRHPDPAAATSGGLPLRSRSRCPRPPPPPPPGTLPPRGRREHPVEASMTDSPLIVPFARSHGVSRSDPYSSDCFAARMQR